jgi:hypothetical protein
LTSSFLKIIFFFHRKLNLTITVAPIQLWKWQMYISQNLRQSWYGNLLGEDENDDDQDAMKVRRSIFPKYLLFFMLFSFQRALVETNPYLLAVTILVSLVHTVFEILAFKNGL